MPKFATYLHPQTCSLSQPLEQLNFVGHSYPHYSQVRKGLATVLKDYPSLPLRKANYREYLRVHTKDYLQNLLLMARNQQVEKPPKLSFECQNLEYCLPGYLYGLGGMIEAIDGMKKGLLERAYCFSLMGHHAHADWGHGYCLLNPLAAAARYAQTQKFDKILILDWDIHHGDGTQSIFSHDPSIYCISIHNAVDLYMAKLSSLQAGTTTTAESVGHCNIPLIPQGFPVNVLAEEGITGKFYQSQESLLTFQMALEQIPWTPDLILIFSGYDSHQADCGKGITDWDNQSFEVLTQSVVELAEKSNCPILSSHGGGYQLAVTLSSAQSHVKVLATS